MPDEKKKFESTYADETIKMSDWDEVDFVTKATAGYYGNDRIVTTSAKNPLSLNFGDGANVDYSINGKDVVLTTTKEMGVRYYVTAKVSGVDGAEPSLDGHTLPDGILDSEGRMRFGMSMASSVGTVGSGIQAGDFVFSSDVIYPDGVEHADGAQGVLIMLENDAFFQKSYVFDGITFSDLKVIKVVGATLEDFESGVVIEDYTEEYKKAIQGATDYSFNQKLFTTSEYRDAVSSVTIANYAAKNPGVDIMIGDEKLSEHEFAVSGSNNNFKGTWLRESAESSVAGETFNLGSGVDKIDFIEKSVGGYFGNDTVILSDGETLDMKIAGDVEYSINGKDVVLTTTKEMGVRYYVTAKVSGVDGAEPSLDGHTLPDGILDSEGRMRFGMSIASSVGTAGSGIQAGDFVFSSDVIYPDGVEHADGAQGVLIMLENDAFFQNSYVFDGITFSDLKVIKVVGATLEDFESGVVIEDYTEEYKKAIQGATDYSFNEKLFTTSEYRDAVSTVTLKDYAGKDIGATVLVNGASIYDTDFAKLVSFDVNNNESLANGKFKGGVLAETINALEFVSKNGAKGVNINSGAGDDMITGSNYNDIIKSNAGNNLVDEWGGTNKITLGKGNDIVELFDFSSNTVKLGNGTNAVGIISVGTNKVTGGKDADGVLAVSGQNTINTGKGESLVLLQGGENKVTGGKDADVYYIGGGLNTIKSGNGKDKFYVGEAEDIDFSKYVEGADDINIEDEGSYNIIKAGNGGNVFNLDSDNATNVVTSGKGVDVFNLSAGTNYVSSGAGADTFKVTGGYNFLDGGKGDDIYDFSTVNGGTARVTDTKGANVLNVGNINLNVFFDVEVGKKGKAIYGDLRFVGDNGSAVTSEEFYMDYYSANKKSFAKISSGYTEGQEVTFNVSDLASQVASWLTENDYASTDAVFAKNDTDDVAALLTMYTGFAQNSYQVV